MTDQIPDLTAASAEGIFAEAGFPSQYKILGVLGQGAMGVVFRAFEQTLERDVAIKVMLGQANDEESRERFLRETRTLAKLDHPNIIKILNSRPQ